MSRQLWALSQHSDYEVFDIVYYVPVIGLSEGRQYPVVSLLRWHITYFQYRGLFLTQESLILNPPR